MILRALSLLMAAMLAFVGCAEDDDDVEAGQTDVEETCRLLAEVADDAEPDEATIEELQEAAPSELDDDVEALGEAEPGSDEFAEAQRELEEFEARECDAGTSGDGDGDDGDDGGPDPTTDDDDDGDDDGAETTSTLDGTTTTPTSTP